MEAKRSPALTLLVTGLVAQQFGAKTLDRDQSQRIIPPGLWSNHGIFAHLSCGFLPSLSFGLGLVCARLEQQYAPGGDQSPRSRNKLAADQIPARRSLARSRGKGPEHGGSL